MNHNLGEVSYDIRFARQKAAQDIAAIEGDWDAMIARVRTKAGNIGFAGSGVGGAQAGGGYSGATTNGGQPQQGTPMRARASEGAVGGPRARDPGLQWLVDRAIAEGRGSIRDMAGQPVNPGNGSSTAANGQPTESYANRLSNVTVDGKAYTVRAQRRAESTEPNAEPGQVPGVQQLNRNNINKYLRGAVSFLVIDAIASELSNESNYRKASQAAGFNQASQARASLGRVTGALGAVPIVGGILQGIVSPLTSAVEMDINRNEAIGAYGNASYGMNLRAGYARTTASATLQAGRPGARLAELRISQKQARVALSQQEQQLEEAAGRTVEQPGYLETAAMNLTRPHGNVFQDLFGTGSESNSYFSDRQSERQEAVMGPLRKARAARFKALGVEQGAEYQKASIEFNENISNAQAGVRRQNLENQLRPGAAYGRFAREVVGNRIEAFNGENAGATSVEQHRNLMELRTFLGGTMEDLKARKLDIERNIYGGRPTEIGGLQSVEAMRDISPESNQAALAELTTAIKELKDEIARRN